MMKRKTYIIIAILCLAGVLAFIAVRQFKEPEIRNIILISIDTCRADYLSCYGYLRKTTPHIDAFAQEATRFEYVLSPVPITLPAHCSMLTGMIPPSHGVHDNIGYNLSPANETLAEILKSKGFGTAAIISSFVMDKGRGLNQGFDTYYDFFKAGYVLTKHPTERKGGETTQVALDWLDRNKNNKSFLFLHYYDPHLEYEPPEPFASQFAGNPYAGEIAFTDHCIGRVIRKLKELDLYDSSLLIITGDHGEMLGEHGEEEHTYFIYESAIKVPLLVKLPGQKKGAVIKQPVGLVDLVPTICSLLEIDPPPGGQGKDLTGFLKGSEPGAYERFIYSESITPTRVGASALMAVSSGRWKFIQAPRPEFYDITVDPGEKNNLIEEEHQRARILEDKLLEILEQSVRKDPNSRVELDDESLKRLRSLGYVAGKADEVITFDKSKEDPKDLILFFTDYQKALTLFDYKETLGEAHDIFLSLIARRPDFYEPYLYLSDIQMFQRNYDQAVDSLRHVIRLSPNQEKALNNLAWLQSTRPSIKSRDVEEALRCAIKLCELQNYIDPPCLDTLAVAYAANGDFDDAVKTAQKARGLAASAGHTSFAETMTGRLKLFEQGKAYVEE